MKRIILANLMMLAVCMISACGGSDNNGFFFPIATTFEINTSSPLAAGTVGTAYSQTLAANNGTTPYTWTLASGSTLPAGLGLSTAGVISGTPTAAATSTFTVTATDSSSPVKTATKQFSITVAAAPIAPQLTISSSSPLAAGTVGTAYSQTLAASNGTTPYTWTLASGSTLPAGLVLSAAGVISGTPTAAATSTFTVIVTDSAAPANTASKQFSITFAAAGVPLTITTTSPLTVATFGTAYSQTLAAGGGTSPYSWATTAGALPAGLSLNAAGVISGTPTAPAVPNSVTSNFTARVTDAILGTASAPFAITTSLSASASAGKTRYDANCAGCHVVGIYDTAGFAPDLGAVSKATIDAKFAGGRSHNGNTLTQPQIDEVYSFVSLY
jgi:mono/diheme cytochrome c family protein